MAFRALRIAAFVLGVIGVIAAIIAWGLLFGSAFMFAITIEDFAVNDDAI